MNSTADTGPGSCIMNLILEALNVPHTPDYTARKFEAITFKSLFGLSNALREYGVDARGWQIQNPDEVLALPVPFLAQAGADFVIVTKISPDAVTIRHNDDAAPREISVARFRRRYGGTVMVFGVADNACEPQYREHRFTIFADKAKKWVLAAAVIIITVYAFAAQPALRTWSLAAVAACYAAGIYVSCLLMLKSHGIATAAGNSICSVIERTGCHTVLSTKASKFFGIVSWAEVGMGYFAISLGLLLCAPHYAPWLAVINACCCPFSFWSIWYQNYRAKAWCTMCLTVQALLWTTLIIYLVGGWFSRLYWPAWGIIAIVAAYIGAVLILNAAGSIFDRFKRDDI